MIITENRTAPTRVGAFAKGPVLAVAAAAGLLLLAISGRYGYFGDELYFLAAGRHLAWGYADQPPLLPLLARAMDTVAPGSVTVLRLPAIAVTVAGIVFAALIARELGGARKAQLMTAGAYAICGQFLGTGHYLATSTMDPFLWTVLLWLLVRWLRTRADGLLVWAGVVTAIAINVKFLILAFWLVAGICALIFGPRDLLRRPRLWIGALIAVAGALPTVIWQANNGWPQLAMSKAISAEVAQIYGGRLMFLPDALLAAGVVIGAVLLCYGVVRLVRTPELRFLGWTTIALTVLFIAINGRAYYICGMFPVCWAAAAVHIERAGVARWWRWFPTWPVYAISALLILPNALPLYPQSWLVSKPGLPRPVFSAEEVGWPEMTTSVARVYQSLPNRSRTAIVTGFYWQASAIEVLAPELPEPYSGNRGYWTLATPPESAQDVLYVGWDPRRLAGHFADVKVIGKVDNGLGIANSSQGMTIWLATGRAEPWSVLWPRLRSFGDGAAS